MQLDLFDTARAAPEWVTGDAVDRSGPAQYVHLIRAQDDPERSARKTGAGRSLAWRTLAKRPIEIFQGEITAHLADGRPRTFNRICVELWDQTADMSHTASEALWALVRDGQVEHTLRAPILFRVRR